MMRAMRIRIVCPAPRGTLFGNRISALRWARILRELGHRVVIETEYDGADCDLLIALHAKRSANAVLEGAGTQARRPVPLVALTGTDLYRDIQHSRKASARWKSRRGWSYYSRSLRRSSRSICVTRCG